jgi:branched-chain amino acid transport system substrate-binding protein
MIPTLKSLVAAVLLLVASGAASAEVVKVGVIGPFSGPNALPGRNFRAGIEAYVALNGDKAGEHTVEIVYRDLPDIDPAKSAALARELVIREGVQYLAGFYTTPNAMAAAPILEEANVPMVIFNAATSSIVTMSPFIVRTSFTTWQTSFPMGLIARERGIDRVVTVVADYGPGIDSETAFKTAFEQAGGQVVESIRMPISTVDFNPIMQRIKDSGAQAIFAFLPSLPTTPSFVNAYVENGLNAAGIDLLAPGDLTQEPDLLVLGDSALGLMTTFHYAVSHDSPENAAFVEAARQALPDPAELSFQAVGAYDGMHVIYEMIKATDGQQDAAAAVEAVKGLRWISPRGPVEIDPASRHITQNIYLREVVRLEDGSLANRELDTYERQPDPGLVAQ